MVYTMIQKNRIFVFDSRPCDKDKIKCEVCSNVLIAKKVIKKVHHYAHKSSDINGLILLLLL